MIRMLFAMFVTLAGFAAAALWMARGGDAREAVEEIFPDEVRSAVRSEVRSAVERFDFEEIASRLPDPAPEADAPADPVAATDTGDDALPQRAAVAEETVEEHDLSPRSEFARDLGAAADDGSDGEDGEETATAVAASARTRGEDAAPPREPDQDEWASLIRRMLAVYHQTRAVE